MSDYDARARRREQEDAVRGYSIGGGSGWVQSVEGRSVPPPIFEPATPPDTDTRRVLIGYSLLFNQIIQHGDGSYMFVRPTAFKDLMIGETKYFQHHHDDDIRVASTKSGLTLLANVAVSCAFPVFGFRPASPAYAVSCPLS